MRKRRGSDRLNTKEEKSNYGERGKESQKETSAHLTPPKPCTTPPKPCTTLL
jgi:hypothetical protein